MNDLQRPNDDLDAYIATLSDTGRADLALASDALDIADLLYRARLHRGLTQKEAAARAGLQQQAVSRLERAATNTTLATLQRYLAELGYTVKLTVVDRESGQVIARASQTGTAMHHRPPIRRFPTRTWAIR